MAASIRVDKDLDALIALARRNGKGADPVTRQKIAELAIGCHVLRWSSARMLSDLLHGRLNPGIASSNKFFTSNLLQALSEAAVEVMASTAFLRAADGPHDFGSASTGYKFLYNRCLTIAGGTSEVQRNIMAQRVLACPLTAALEHRAARLTAGIMRTVRRRCGVWRSPSSPRPSPAARPRPSSQNPRSPSTRRPTAATSGRRPPPDGGRRRGARARCRGARMDGAPRREPAARVARLRGDRRRQPGLLVDFGIRLEEKDADTFGEFIKYRDQGGKQDVGPAYLFGYQESLGRGRGHRRVLGQAPGGAAPPRPSSTTGRTRPRSGERGRADAGRRRPRAAPARSRRRRGADPQAQQPKMGDIHVPEGPDPVRPWRPARQAARHPRD